MAELGVTTAAPKEKITTATVRKIKIVSASIMYYT
jgi:hypothetical protein